MKSSKTISRANVAATTATARPEEAYQQYVEDECAASDAYERYWLDKFKAAGLDFKEYHGAYGVWFNGLEIKMFTSPARYTGVKVVIAIPAGVKTYQTWVDYKVKSESGFLKLMRRLKTQQIL